MLTQSIEERASTLYTVRNDDATPRDVVIEHPVRAGWTLTSGVKPAESSASAHRFRVTVAPKATATLTVAEMRPIDSQVAVSNISDDQIALILRGRNVAAGIEPQLHAVAAQSREVARVQQTIYERQAEIRRIGEDQARVRENLKALKGSDAEKALAERYSRQLSTQEIGSRCCGARPKRPRPIGRRSSRSCRRPLAAVVARRRAPDVSDPLRRLPDLAAHLATALAGPLPGARIHDRLSPRLLDGSLPPPAGRDRPAAVLILLFPRDEVPHVVLTVRGADLPHHADQISLPGGRPAPGETPEDTALREAVEEIGVDVTGLTIAGRLTPVHIGVSGFTVQPIVALSDTAPVFVPAPGEVAAVLEVPLALLADPATLRSRPPRPRRRRDRRALLRGRRPPGVGRDGDAARRAAGGLWLGARLAAQSRQAASRARAGSR